MSQTNENHPMNETEARELTERVIHETQEAHVLASLYGYGEKLPRLGDWTVNRRGVYTCEVNAVGAVKIVTACRVPVVISKLIEDAENGVHGVELAFLQGGGWRFTECRRSDIADKSKIIGLSDRGLPVTSDSSKYLVRYLDGFLADNADFIARKKVISRLGWIGGRFIPYCQEPVLCDSCHVKGLVSCCGSFEEWQRLVKRLIDRNSHLRLFLSASFASALLEPLGLQNFLVHLWGRTGSGKSVALMLAASVWGDPEGKLFGTMNGTLNYLQSQASMLRNIPLFLDELQTIRETSGNYDKLIMQLGVGVGRGRANRAGLAKKTVEWRNVALCTGEEPLIRPDSGGGAVNRVLQICVDDLEGDLIPDGGEVVRTVRRHYGEAGRRFIDALLDEEGRMDSKITDGMKQMFEEYLDEIMREVPTSGKQGAILAAVLTADTLADVAVYNTGERLRLSDVKEFAASADEISKPIRAMEYVRNMISIHVNDFVGTFKDEKTGQYIEGYGHQPSGRVYGKLTEETATVNRQVILEWLNEGGFSFDSVKKVWAERGFLQKNSQGRFTCHPPYGMTGTFLRLNLRTDDQLR